MTERRLHTVRVAWEMGVEFDADLASSDPRQMALDAADVAADSLAKPHLRNVFTITLPDGSEWVADVQARTARKVQL